MVPFSMILDEFLTAFQGQAIIQRQISQKRYKIDTRLLHIPNRKWYVWTVYVPSPITSSDLWRSLQVQTVFLPVSLKRSNKNVRTDVSNYFYYRVLVYWTGQTAIGPMCCWARSVSQCLCTYIIMPLLQRDATHKRGLCRRAVSVCLSRSCIVSKRIKISAIFITFG